MSFKHFSSVLVLAFVVLVNAAPGSVLPDFNPDSTYLRQTMSIDYVNADADPCLINEKCLSGRGMRKVLRFGTMVHNKGTADAVLGPPPINRNDPANPRYWHWDSCHNHWHFTEYADYELLVRSANATNTTATGPSTLVNRALSMQEINTGGFVRFNPKRHEELETGADVGISAIPEGFASLPGGHKNGFCLEDLVCSTGKSVKYNCTNQGVQMGCSDIYDDSLACQWVDITDVPDPLGEVIVRVHINPNRFFPELNMDNNIAEAQVRLSEIPRRVRASGNFPGYVDSPVVPGSPEWFVRGGGGRAPPPGGL
ncbi:hypothetical protein HK098_002518 [Nowakowskiella sp. JEL0407]|nr:hypothetical protein HK098_002518 [Nowakowskiella sp. JEL0407]